MDVEEFEVVKAPTKISTDDYAVPLAVTTETKHASVAMHFGKS